MRRRPLFLQAFLALVVFWLAAGVSAGGTPTGAGNAFGSVQREMPAILSPHATIAGSTASRKTAAPDWSSRGFLPSRRLITPDGSVGAPSAVADSGLRDRASRTVTYDATAPPAS